jgi:hypothetical protein
MTYTGSVPASIVALPPRETGVPLSVMLELVKDALPILVKVLLAPLIVLLVKVCAVFKSTVTPVSILTVTVPEVPPPDKPVPAVTPVISPALARLHSSPVAVALLTLKT